MPPERAYLIVSQGVNPGGPSRATRPSGHAANRVTVPLRAPTPGASSADGRPEGATAPGADAPTPSTMSTGSALAGASVPPPAPVDGRSGEPSGPPAEPVRPAQPSPRAQSTGPARPVRATRPRSDSGSVTPAGAARSVWSGRGAAAGVRRPSQVRGGDDATVLVRRHRPGRHRAGDAGRIRYRPARRWEASVVHRSRHGADRVRRGGRHAVPRRPSPRAATVARYASLLVILSTLAVSSWFAASGASAFAELIKP